jgi:hypothetical protein
MGRPAFGHWLTVIQYRFQDLAAVGELVADQL